ncbi:hypothetical protein [Lysobacter fragariae]
MTSTSKKPARDVAPDQRKLTSLQAQRLAAMSDLDARELTGLTTVEIGEKFRFRIDPMLLLFRRVCGRVVKKDPATGMEYPVPYATVHVEDTDCSLLGYFPVVSKWAWYFPFRCHREVIATAKTDECGNFCVWIPRWDIDWVLRWRHERICLPIAFERPSIRDILDDLIPREPIPPIPQPGPDPAPFVRLDRGVLIRRIEDHIGRDAARSIARADAAAGFGDSRVALDAALDAAAFPQPIPPPLPKEMQVRPRGKGDEVVQYDAARDSLAARLQLNDEVLRDFDLRRYIGPFKRCFDILVPEWKAIFDVPDISFRVTQDTDGDGDEETIYAEGHFQVRWNAGAIGPLTLHAGPNARAGLACGDLDGVPCANDPAIVLAGRVPVANEPTLYNAAEGYMLRSNRPHPSGLISDPLPNPDATTPFYGVVTLLGCNKTNAKATQYRVMFKYSNDNGATFTSYAPFVGLTWPLFRLDGSGNPQWHYPASDAQGWYPIALPAGPNPFLPQDILLDWPTGSFANGRYVLKVEVGSGGTVMDSSAEIAFNVDNSAPSGPMTVEWRKVGGGAFQLLDGNCPVVKRGVVPADLEFRVTLSASARHLRSATLTAAGCGNGNFALQSGTTEHWYTTASDNSETLQAIYRLSAAAAQGTYSFAGHVVSRAISPSGYDGGHLAMPAWEYDRGDIHIDPNFSFSVVDMN